jgi:3-hydroxy-3-methylglutaryl CoA synthase
MSGIISHGVYVPYHRLQRRTIGATLGGGQAVGERAVASYDEDTTSMAVEAARLTLRAMPDSVRLGTLLFATANPAYLDKNNASAIHAALGLDGSVAAYDMGGAVRSSVGALRLAAGSAAPTMVVAADLRTGLPGGADEGQGGDAAAAIVVGDGEFVIAEIVAASSATSEFLDHWRIPGARASNQWEERFGEHAYLPLAQTVVTDALKQAGIVLDEIDHVIIGGIHLRAVRSALQTLQIPAEKLRGDRGVDVGNVGAAQMFLGLADALERAEPGQYLLAVSLADGADAIILRTTDALSAYSPAASLSGMVASGNNTLSYASFLTWRGMLERELPRRPEPERPAAPASLRSEDWKFHFVGSRCRACSAMHLPPHRVCVGCGAIDQMKAESLADTPGKIATYAVDRLAFSLNPPVVIVVVDFDGGGRFQCELTDVDPDGVHIGQRVEMTFRRMFTADSIHNYFWKARPVRERKADG